MAFSKEWENIYKNDSGSTWPWSDLISSFYKIISHLPNNPSVLELGFGKGANIPFFLFNSIDYFGVEGSENALKLAIKSFPELKKKLHLIDFTDGLVDLKTKFNLIFDRASVCHNNKADIENTIIEIYNSLDKDGYFIGIDWFGDEHAEFLKGTIIDDKMTKFFNKESYFKGYGKVHFVNEDSIYSYFKNNFSFIHLEKKIKIDMATSEQKVFYDFIVKKI